MDKCNFYTQTEEDSMSDDSHYSVIKLVLSRTSTDRKVSRYKKPRIKL
jgi:hypothetical protein